MWMSVWLGWVGCRWVGWILDVAELKIDQSSVACVLVNVAFSVLYSPVCHTSNITMR